MTTKVIFKKLVIIFHFESLPKTAMLIQCIFEGDSEACGITGGGPAKVDACLNVVVHFLIERRPEYSPVVDVGVKDEVCQSVTQREIVLHKLRLAAVIGHL